MYLSHQKNKQLGWLSRREKNPEDANEQTLQAIVFDIGKRHPYPELRAWFGTLYEVLLGQKEGPRFDSFITVYGVKETIALIESKLT